jgi:uncharacterized protein (UPF0548 family)
LFHLTEPSEEQVRRFIAEQKGSRFSYLEVGASSGDIPSRYNVDRNRIRLGKGEVTWHRAVAAVRGWQMFDIPWVRLYWPNAPMQVGTDVAVSVHHFGFYSLNACRIVYIIDEDGSTKRFGFAYGTLWEHAESGEERFAVEWRRDKDEIWYDLLAFSRPRNMAVRFAYPLSRKLRGSFAKSSKLAMLRATETT